MPAAQVFGVETGRRVHRDQGERDEQVGLDHVHQGACPVVVARSPLEGQSLVEGDLDPIDVFSTPHLPEDAVREAQTDDVEHRRLAEKVIHPVDVLLRHQLQELPIQRLCAAQVSAERFLESEHRAGGQFDLLQRSAGEDGDRRRQGEIERGDAGRRIEYPAQILSIGHIGLQVHALLGDALCPCAGHAGPAEGLLHSRAPRGIRHPVLTHPDQVQVDCAVALEQLAETGEEESGGEVA